MIRVVLFFSILVNNISIPRIDNRLISNNYSHPGKAIQQEVQLNWKDRRPICAVFLSSFTGKVIPGNPRNWKIESVENFNVNTNVKAFHQAVLKHADNSVLALKDMNAQGIVVWDIEGEQYPHPISYIGDPRMVPLLAPEMNAIADKFFKKFTDANLKVGICLRPDEVKWDPNAKQYWHYGVKDPFANLKAKITYARKRWGCTMFYVDSNVWPDPIYGQLMHDSVFRKLNQLFPDCLIMPEHENQEYYKYTAPYQQMKAFRHILTAEKEQNPHAFMVLYVPEGFPGMLESDKLIWMKQSIKQGNILMFRNWYADPINLLIKKAYRGDLK